MMFGEAGAEILYPNPGFPIYESVIRFSGAEPVPIPLLEEKDFSFDAEAVLAQITPATRLLILNSPANPTGGLIEADATTLAYLRAVGGSDEALVAVAGDPDAQEPLEFHDGTDLPNDLLHPQYGWDGATNQITDAFNEGRFLFTYRAHGGWRGWGHPSSSPAFRERSAGR